MVPGRGGKNHAKQAKRAARAETERREQTETARVTKFYKLLWYCTADICIISAKPRAPPCQFRVLAVSPLQSANSRHGPWAMRMRDAPTRCAGRAAPAGHAAHVQPPADPWCGPWCGRTCASEMGLGRSPSAQRCAGQSPRSPEAERQKNGEIQSVTAINDGCWRAGAHRRPHRARRARRHAAMHTSVGGDRW